MTKRGEIRDQQLGAQVRDYSGLRFGQITPTDIDGYIEYHGRAHVTWELKYRDTELPYGQRLALERNCDDLNNTRPAIAIIASHDARRGEVIDGANAIATEVRFNGKWMRIHGRTLGDVVEAFLRWIDVTGSQGGNEQVA